MAKSPVNVGLSSAPPENRLLEALTEGWQPRHQPIWPALQNARSSRRWKRFSSVAETHCRGAAVRAHSRHHLIENRPSEKPVIVIEMVEI